MATESLKVSRIYKDLDLNFTANPVTGDVSKKLDVNAVKQSLNILMRTNFYERPFEPEKGANLRGYLFEPMSNILAGVIKNTIKNLIETYEPRAKIESLLVVANYDDNSYDITLRYFVVGTDKPQTLTANLKRLR
jgi:phage baseplate assembly protein W